MKRLFLGVLLAWALSHGALAADTDGDGLLDLLDVPGFDPHAMGTVYYGSRGIQDLDGSGLLTRATVLDLYNNRITSVESGDFEGLGDLQGLYLNFNQITSVESGAFRDLGHLQTLGLEVNQITSIE